MCEKNERRRRKNETTKGRGHPKPDLKRVEKNVPAGPPRIGPSGVVEVRWRGGERSRTEFLQSPKRRASE